MLKEKMDYLNATLKPEKIFPLSRINGEEPPKSKLSND